MALTHQQRDLVRQIGSGTPGAWAVQRGPEKLACQDMAFGRKRDCKCYACTQARRVQAEAVAKYGNNMPYQFYTYKRNSKGMR